MGTTIGYDNGSKQDGSEDQGPPVKLSSIAGGDKSQSGNIGRVA